MEAFMAKIMNVGLTSLSIIFMTLSFAVAGELHPGLKNAIDNGDYKTAKNLVEKVGVTDVYCPGSLSVKDAEKVYGSILKKNPLAILDGNGLSFDFSIKYAEEKCNGSQYEDVKICYQWVMNQKQIKNDLWKRMFDKWFKEGKGLCLNAETMNNCLLYVNSKSDYKDKMEIIRQVEKKKLIKFEGTFEKDTVVKEPIPKDQCLLNLKDFEQMQTLFIGAKQNATGTFEFPFGFCSFNGTKQAINTCVKKLHEAVKDAEKKCKNGKMTKDVKKTIKRKGHVFPLEYEMMEIRQNLLAAKWYEMGDEWWENFTLLSKYLDGPKEKDVVDEMKQKYSSKGDFDITELVRNCKIYPNIDKSVKKVFGFEAFSCSQIKQDYTAFAEKLCKESERDWIKVLPLSLNKSVSIAIVCDKKIKKVRQGDYYETETGRLCDETMNSWIDTAHDVVCDRKIGKFRSTYDLESKMGMLCEDPKESWIDTTKNIVCDKKTGKFRLADDAERFLKRLCEKPEESWIDPAYPHVVCDKNLGRFRTANDFESGAGKLCIEPKESWISESHRIVCDKKIGEFRAANHFEEKTGKLCEDPQESWINETKEVVCDDKLGTFRVANKVEHEAGLCVKEIYGKEFQSFTCVDGVWQKTKFANTDGVVFENGKIVSGKVNDKYKYFKDFRDGQVYRVVKIGNQIWMAENLNLNYNSCGKSDGNLEGAQYQYNFVAKNVCPQGWHIPDTTEWNKLFSFVGGAGVAGKKLKSNYGWTVDNNGSDDYGFSVFPTGFRRFCGDEARNWQSFASFLSYPYDENGFYVNFEESSGAEIGQFSGPRERNVMSVRCVKDYAK